MMRSLSSVQFSHSVMFNSLWPHGLQHTRLPCPSRSLLKLISIESVMPSNHLILCHPFSYHLQSFPAPGSLPVSQFFASGGQSIGVSSFSISPSNEYSGLISFRIDWILRLRIFNLSTNDILKRTTEDEPRAHKELTLCSYPVHILMGHFPLKKQPSFSLVVFIYVWLCWVSGAAQAFL